MALLDDMREAGIGVLDRASPSYPTRLASEPSPPPVLFFQGDATELGRRTVAIVGTRRCTGAGAELAYELGAHLAASDVAVVSGLAEGIDAAAHAGALGGGGAPPLGVVASGLDRPYPRRNLALWRAVAEAGCLVSEAPLGTSPERWRFPARNRIIAGLAEVVIVVESHAAGGSLHTAAAAIERDRPVVAVPGSVRSPASEGTNRLLADGAHVMCSIDDVFTLLDLVAGTVEPEASTVRPITGPGAHVLDAVGWVPTAFDDVVRRSGMDVHDAADAVEQLVASRHLIDRGGWFERTAQPGRPARPHPVAADRERER
jgi:DNA processing protein